MGMSQKELKEWKEAGYIVNNPQNYNPDAKKQDCFEHAVDQISKDIPGWQLNKKQYKLADSNGKMSLQKQINILNEADKRDGVSRLSLNLSNDKKDFKEQLGKVFSVLALNQDEDFIKNFSMTLNGLSSADGSHMHTIDLSALKNGKQNHNPRFAFKDLKKMEDYFSKFEKVTLDVRSKLDFNNDETLKKLNKLLEVLPLNTNGILIKDNYKPA